MEEEEGGHLAVHLHDNSPVTNVPSVAVEAEEGGRLTIHLHDDSPVTNVAGVAV